MVRITMTLLATLSLTACGNPRDLKITEVGKREVELYLDEPVGNAMGLEGHRLVVTTSDGATNEVDLGALGRSLDAREFIIVWEDGSFTGAPEAAQFSGGVSGYVDGIRVPNNFFRDMHDADAAEVKLTGRNPRGAITDTVDDVMRFGSLSSRPHTGGVFDEDLDPPLAAPTGSFSLQRRWAVGGPLDGDVESDWKMSANSWGEPTP